MSHGITEYDVGYVEGSTWHHCPQYIILNRPPTLEEAGKVFNIPMQKEQLFRAIGNVWYAVEGAFCITRTDYNIVLANNVGTGFNIVQNQVILDYLKNGVLKNFPQLEIESVGSLFSGATVFINLKVHEYQIQGDASKIMNRLMFFNPIGQGAYHLGAHSIRIVCNNTLNAAKNQSKQNGSLLKISHTKNAELKIDSGMEDIAENILQLEKQKEQFIQLTKVSINTEFVESFIKSLVKAKNEKDVHGRTENTRQEILNRWKGTSETLTQKLVNSKYGLLQAITDFYDHGGTMTKRSDMATKQWNGMVGQKSELKQNAYQMLLAA